MLNYGVMMNVRNN